MAAQEFVDALRRGDYSRALELRNFITKEYSNIGEMAADSLIPLTVYELSLTDINEQDRNILEFLDLFIQEHNRQIPHEFQYNWATFVTGAITALNIKKILNADLQQQIENIRIESPDDMKKFNSDDSDFSRLIQASRDQHVDLQPMSGDAISTFVQNMDKEVLANFAKSLNTISENERFAKYPELYKNLSQRVPAVYDDYEHTRLTNVANDAIKRGELSVLEACLNKTFINENGEVKKYLDNIRDKKQFLQTAIENNQQQVIDELFKYEGLRFTPQQFCTYAENHGFSYEQVEAFSKIFVKLHEIEKMIPRLKDDGFNNDARFLSHFANAMHYRLKSCLDGKITPDEFLTKCERPVQHAMIRLDEHRGVGSLIKDFFNEMVTGFSSLISIGKWAPKSRGLEATFGDFKTRWVQVKQEAESISADLHNNQEVTVKSPIRKTEADAMDFLLSNRAFFLKPFENQPAFAGWVNELDSVNKKHIMSISNKLKQCLHNHEGSFFLALESGNKEDLKKFVNSPNFKEAKENFIMNINSIANRNNDVINHWNEEHNPDAVAKMSM